MKFYIKKNNENNIENDIVYKIYNENQLNYKWLLYILENCTSYLTISSSLIKKDNIENYQKCFLKII